MMKKLSMMAMVLVAFVAFTLQSCSKGNDGIPYNLSASLVIQENGRLTDEQKKIYEETYNVSPTINYSSDEEAEKGTEEFVGRGAANIQAKIKNETGDANFVFVYTVTTTRLSDNKQIFSCLFIQLQQLGSLTISKSAYMKLNITAVSIIRRMANIIGNNNSINTDNPRHD